MAETASITSYHNLKALAPAAQDRVAVLFAYRSGLLALVKQLATIAEQDGKAPDTPAERAFEQACSNLGSLNRRILSAKPQSLADLEMQATVAVEDMWGEPLPAAVATVLSNIAYLRARGHV